MFQIFTVPEHAAEVFEQLGTKRKFWFWNDQEQKCLFKEGRPGTGENWAEKVACELCSLIGIPHANYDLAQWKENKGVISPTFVPDGGRLVLGNELLPHFVEGYEKKKKYKQKQHTIKRALILVKSQLLNPPIGFTGCDAIKTTLDVFIGYLMLDAWIANQDRHHENWGIVLSKGNTMYLAPTFDHASGFGRNETDESRIDRLTTRDSRRTIVTYVNRAITPFYLSPSSTEPLSTVDAFKEAAKFSPDAGLRWLEMLESIEEGDILSIFEKIPYDLISRPAKDFAQKLLSLNKGRLLSLREVLS